MIEIYDLMIPQHKKERESISFFQCGIEHCVPRHSIGPKMRLYTSMHFVLEGEGYLIIDKKKYHVHAGQAFLLPANKETYYYADEKNPWKYCWVDFFGAEKEQYSEKIFGKDNYVKTTTSVHEIYNVIKDLIKKFYDGEEELEEMYGDEVHLYSVKTWSQLLRANAIVCEVLALMLEEAQIDCAKDSMDYLSQIKNYIDTYFLEIGKVADIAERFHLHPNYLTAIYKEKYHISPKKYLLERKLDYASYLLIETDYSVQEIAQRCGFSSFSSFGKIHKKYKELAPGVFRKLVREQKLN